MKCNEDQNDQDEKNISKFTCNAKPFKLLTHAKQSNGPSLTLGQRNKIHTAHNHVMHD